MIKIIKLVNDHEIIGEVISEGSDHLILGQPFSIHYMMSARSDKPIIGLLRYMPFAKDREISFKHRDVINSVEARESMISYYTQIVQDYINYIDDGIDRELEQVAADSADKPEMTPSEVMADLLSRINNDKMH